ncbi:hypothetical protein ACTL6U_08540 [Rhodovibrionaceae bacterium A322]
MNLQDLENKYPELVKQILSRASGQLGEYLVSEQLRALGCKTEFTKNKSELDLYVTTPANQTVKVEVKTVRQKTSWFVRKRPHSADAWVFVLALETTDFVPTADQITYWVYTQGEVQMLWDKNPWNINNPTNGDIRQAQMIQSAQEAWDKILLWEE